MSSSTEQDNVTAIEEQRRLAISAGDALVLAELLHEDYLHCHANGLVQTRGQLVDHAIMHRREVLPRTPRIDVFGDVALMRGEMVNKVVDAGGAPNLVRLYVTQTLVRSSGTWKFLSFQATGIR